MEALYGPEWQTDLPPRGSAPPPGAAPEEEELLSISAGEPGEASAELASQALSPAAPQGIRSQASSTVGNEGVFQDPSEERLESALGMAFDPEKKSAMKYAKRAYRLAEKLVFEKSLLETVCQMVFLPSWFFSEDGFLSSRSLFFVFQKCLRKDVSWK